MFLLLFTRGRRVGTPNQSREQGSDSSDSGSTVPNPPAWVFTGAEAANYRQLRLETAVPSLKQTRSAQFPGKRSSREVARQNASTPGRQWRVARTGRQIGVAYCPRTNLCAHQNSKSIENCSCREIPNFIRRVECWNRRTAGAEERIHFDDVAVIQDVKRFSNRGWDRRVAGVAFFVPIDQRSIF